MRVIFTFIVIFISGCASQGHDSVQEQSVVNQFTDKEKMLNSGYQMLVDGNAIGAINKHLKSLIIECDALYGKSEKRIYAARNQAEALFYMLKAASEEKSAITVSPTCADGFYYMGYASLDLGKLEKAKQYIYRAIEMSPVNSMYLSELAHIYQLNKNWDKALSTYTKAEEYASVYSPDPVKASELTRAKRGIGFVLIELGEIKKAKVKFEECLIINPRDRSAIKELNYIESINKDS